MLYLVHTLAAVLPLAVLYATLAVALRCSLRRPKIPHLLAAGVTALVYLVWITRPENDRIIVLQFIGNSVGWFTMILFIGSFSIVLVSTLGAIVIALVKHRVRVRSRQGLMAIFCIGLCLASLNWVIGQCVIYNGVIGGDAFRGRIEGDQ